MDALVYPSFVKGEVNAPPSKSYTIRAIAAAMLAAGKSTIINPSSCDDALAMLNIAHSFRAEIKFNNQNLEIQGGLKSNPEIIYCNESALTARLMIAIAALSENKITITGSGTLLKRHLGNVNDPLEANGVKFTSNNGFLPVSVQGRLKPGYYLVDGSESSQFISGLLMALPLLNNDSQLIVNNLKSAPYLKMTLEVLRAFNVNIETKGTDFYLISGNQAYCPQNFIIEGDWSGAAFPIIAALLNGEIDITGLLPHSLQADKKLNTILEDIGIKTVCANNKLHLKKSEIPAFVADCTHTPDLVPALVILASQSAGKCRITGASRLFYKESNRALALKLEMSKLGIEIIINGNEIIIYPGKIQPGEVSSHNDHRIAMAMMIAGLIAEGPLLVKDVGCISKSYPQFIDSMQKCGAQIETILSD